MADQETAFKDIDSYIAQCPGELQPMLREVRKVIHEEAPKATERISWNMPTFYLNGNLIHFFAQKKHLGIYPGASGIEKFAKRFDEEGYKYSKGAVQFPYSKPIPYGLIREMVRFRVTENEK